MTPVRRTTPPALRVLSLGLGRQSTTALLMSHHRELPRLDAAIFADTQSEPKAVYETLEWLTAAVDIPIYRVTVGNLGEDILAASHGQPTKTRNTVTVGQPPFYVKNPPNKDYATPDRGGVLWRNCTKDYKIVPIHRKIRDLLGVKAVGRLPKGVWIEQWIGFTRDELARTFCSDVQWITNTFPLILPAQMTTRDCLTWLEAHGYPIPVKSSCKFCPYHDNAYWRRMRDHQPDEWEETITFEARLHAGKLPGVRGIPYLHKSMVPLALAPIDEPDTGPELFCHACNS